MTTCIGCRTVKERNANQWWSLNNYFGLSGQFCPDCYDKVSHNSYQEPNRPKDYMLMLLKLSDSK